MGTFDAKKWHDEATNARQPKVDTVQERIQYAQSWNLAVAMMAPIADKVAGTLDADEAESTVFEDEIKTRIEEWQKYFLNKLKHE